MGLNKQERAERKAAKMQKKREHRRKLNEFVRNAGGDTYKGYEAIWEYENGCRFPRALKHEQPRSRDHDGS